VVVGEDPWQGLNCASPVDAPSGKIFVWHTGFWGEKASGWHYDLMLILMNLVIAFTNGGAYVLMRKTHPCCCSWQM
jgi:hypothetical protein